MVALIVFFFLHRQKKKKMKKSMHVCFLFGLGSCGFVFCRCEKKKTIRATMEGFVQKWIGKILKNDAKRVERGSKMEPKCIQKSSKIDAKIEVGKSSKKETLRLGSGQWIFGQKRSKTASEKW